MSSKSNDAGKSGVAQSTRLDADLPQNEHIVVEDELASRIAERAHAKFVARGGEHGHDVEDWHASAAEIANDTVVVAEDAIDDKRPNLSTHHDGVQLR